MHWKFPKECRAKMLYLQAGRSSQRTSSKSTGKSNFVETRTFWHIFRSFDRMWTFYILALQVLWWHVGWNVFSLIFSHMYTDFPILQAMVVVAWSGYPLEEIFQKDIWYSVSSIFITAAFLRFLQSMSFSKHIIIIIYSGFLMKQVVFHMINLLCDILI